MYIEFLFVIADYFSTLDKRSFIYDWGIAIFIGCASALGNLVGKIDLYVFVNNAHSFITTLLGFTLAALALFLTNNATIDNLKKIITTKTIRGENISLYKLLLINFSYSIIIESILCIGFYIGGIFCFIDSLYIPIIINSIYVICLFNILLLTIRCITDLYLILSKT